MLFVGPRNLNINVDVNGIEKIEVEEEEIVNDAYDNEEDEEIILLDDDDAIGDMDFRVLDFQY